MRDDEGREKANRVRAWLVEEHLFVKSVDDKANLAVFECKTDAGFPFGVILPLDAKSVLLVSNAGFGDKERMAMNTLIDDDDKFLPNLQLSMLYIGCGFKLFGTDGRDYQNGDELTTIRFLTGVHSDGLSKETLMRAEERIDRAWRTLTLLFQLHGKRIRPRASQLPYS